MGLPHGRPSAISPIVGFFRDRSTTTGSFVAGGLSLDDVCYDSVGGAGTRTICQTFQPPAPGTKRMPHDRHIKASLWITCPFNFVAGYTFAFPSSLTGRLVELPTAVPPVYAAATGFMVCLFGGMYAWMALQKQINRPMLCLGAIGKAGVFVLASVLWLRGTAPGPLVVAAAGDLAFAALWFRWLAKSRGR